MDNKVPGGVYLCQVDEQISCGECCGLYNVTDASYGALKGGILPLNSPFKGG